MNAMTVKILRVLAKQRGLKRYSQFKKAELIQLLTSVNIIDEPVPNIGQSPLKPQPFKHILITKIRDLGKWIKHELENLVTIP